MKTLTLSILALTLTAFTVTPAAQAAEEIFRIQIGSNSMSGTVGTIGGTTTTTSGGFSSYSSARERELMRRIYQLELAVDQLQRKVFDMESERSFRPVWTTCYIQTPFDGTFRSTEPTETAARAKVLDRCSKTVGHSANTFCQEREIKCGK